MRPNASSSLFAANLLAMLLAAGTCLAGSPPEKNSAAVDGLYTGQGSCSASACHGSPFPKSTFRVSQDEYGIWAVQDKHAKAFAALTTNPLSAGIKRNLNMTENPEVSRRCLPCHSLDAPLQAQERTFDEAGGVSCESCHGPASGWLAQHFNFAQKTDVTPAELAEHHRISVQHQMYDTKDIIKREEKCLDCHLGSALPGQSVDHEMIAAGHPMLRFEIDSYEAAMPRHWKQPRATEPWLDVRLLSVGEAVQLKKSMEKLIRDLAGPYRPEYSEYDCYGCHHSLIRPENSWRIQFGKTTGTSWYAGRRPGEPPLDTAHFAVLRQVLAGLDPPADKDLEKQMQVLWAAASQAAPKPGQDYQAQRNAIQEQARQSAALAGKIAMLVNRSYNRSEALRILRNICVHREELSRQGERTAEQALMALNSIYLALDGIERPPHDKEVLAAIQDLFGQVNNPSSYEPKKFSDGLAQIELLLP